jgi:fucose 4-O-acetylase-like acetyltransferase
MGLRAAGIVADIQPVAIMLYALYLFHMPLFFLLSGLNVAHSLQRGLWPFAINKLWLVVYPYFLWSALQGGVQIALSGSLNEAMKPGDLLRIGWAPFAQFWFLYALAFCHLLALVFRRRLTWLLPFGLVAAVVSPFAPYPLDKCLFNLVFYALALAFGPQILAARGSWRGLAGAASLFVLAAIANAAIMGLRFDQALALPAACAGIAGVIISSRLLTGPVAALLASAGRISMTIYILHILAAAGTRVVMVKLGVPPDPLIYVIAGTAMGVALPVLAHHVLARLDWLAPLGLAAKARGFAARS